MNGRAIPLVLVAVAVLGAGVGLLVTGMDGDLSPEEPAPQPPTRLAFEDATNGSGLAYSYRAEIDSHGNGRQGVYVSDTNRDGWPDLLAVGGNGEHPSLRLFRNHNGTFVATDAIPTDHPALDGRIKSAHFVDADRDGWEDLVVFPTGGGAVLLENVEGRFSVLDRNLTSQISYALGATTLDYNGDACPDLFVIQSGNWKEGFPRGYQLEQGEVEADNGRPNVLLRGTCSGFEPVANSGITGAHWSLATSAADFDGDGDPDLHIANDYHNNVVYRNLGDGRFERVVLGEATNRNGMSSELADVDGDGSMDIVVTNINLTAEVAESDAFRQFIQYSLGKRGQGNNLLRNTGDGSFEAVGAEYGIQAGGWGYAAVLDDLDNDGDQDLLHTTAELRGVTARVYESLSTPMLWERTDSRFHKLSAADRGFNITDGRGMAALDFDRDGDLDIVIANFDGAFTLYENVGATANWLQLRILSEDRSATAVGARARIVTENGTYHRVLNARSDFLSQDSRVIHVGLGNASTVEAIEVRWPDGTTRRLTDVGVNQRLLISPTRTMVANATVTGQ